jgi:FtsH-binding integral membrane protein
MSNPDVTGTQAAYVATSEPRESIGAALGYLAGFLNAAGFVWYCQVMFASETTTNPISWWLWLGETLISLVIYWDYTRDKSKAFAEFVSLIGAAVVSLYLLWRVLTGDSSIVFSAVETVDYYVGGFAVVAFVVWFVTRDVQNRHKAKLAVIVFQLALFAAVVPLVRSTYADPSAEPLGPWVLWTGVFLLQSICAGLRWDGWTPLISPINYTLTHFLVVLAIILGTASS